MLELVLKLRVVRVRARVRVSIRVKGVRGSSNARVMVSVLGLVLGLVG